MKKEKPNYSREHLAYLKKQKKKNVIIHISRWLILGLLLGLWELFAQLKIIDPFITSSPSRVCNIDFISSSFVLSTAINPASIFIMHTIIETITVIKNLYSNNTLFYHIGVTLMETMAGFIIAVIVGYAIAVA